MLQAGLGLAQRFTLTRRLGGGDVAPVWLAADSGTSQDVVLKFRPQAELPTQLERLLELLKGLDHPSLLLPRGSGQEAGQAFLVFDWLPGGSLDQFRGRPVQVWIDRLREVAAALAYLHRNGLVHGDVKAANVLLGEQGRARLGDFDNLLPAGASRDAQAAVSGFTVSPQQRAHQAAQPADDIYSLGAMIHELLYGQPPGYGGADMRGTMPPEGTPDTLTDLMQQCLGESEPERPASMAMIEQTLGDIVVGGDIPQAATTTASPEGKAPQRAMPLLTPPEAPAASLRSQWQRPASRDEQPDARAIRRQGFRMGLAAAAVVVLLAAAVAVFVLPLGRNLPPPVVGKSQNASPAEPNAAPAAATVPAPAAATAPAAAPATATAPEPVAAAAPSPAPVVAPPPSPAAAAATSPARKSAATPKPEQGTAASRPAASGDTATTQKFGAAMARGFAALKAGQYAEAHTAFEEAHTLQPEDSGVAAALTELSGRETNQQIVEAMKQGTAFLSAAQWSQAAPQFQRALALDESLTAARTGLAQANERIDLDNRLRQYLERPERSYGAAGLATGQELLVRAEAVAAPDATLARQTAQLKEQLRVAATPLNLELKSDSATQITIYRIGALGVFATRSLQLKPGHYVVVGTRAGFRDVRVELDLTPANAPLSVRVSCVDPI